MADIKHIQFRKHLRYLGALIADLKMSAASMPQVHKEAVEESAMLLEDAVNNIIKDVYPPDVKKAVTETFDGNGAML